MSWISTRAMQATVIAALAAAPLACLATEGQDANRQAATQPASAPATAPAPTAETRPATSGEALAALEAMERAGEKHKTVRAKVTYRVVNTVFGDVDVRTGWVAYAAGDEKENPRYRLHFDTLAHSQGRTRRARLDYAFDGHWFIDVNHKARQYRGQQLAAEGRRVDPLKIGQGPFPLPFGQKADDVLAHFTVTARPAGEGEPAGTTYLDLATIRRFRKNFNLTRLEMWLDPKLGLPVRIISHDAGTSISTVDFAEIETNVPLEDKTFKLPKRLGYSVEMRKLQE